MCIFHRARQVLKINKEKLHFTRIKLSRRERQGFRQERNILLIMKA